MKELQTLNELIDKASSIAGSDGKLAKVLNVPPQHVSNWRHGLRNCSPEDVALMASLAGLNAEAWLIRAVVEKHQGTAKGDRLMQALGKGLLLTGAAIASSGATAAAIFSKVEPSHLVELVQLAASTMYRRVKFSAQKHQRPLGAFFHGGTW